MLFVGVQFVVWSITGTYMVVFDINYIHGNSLVTEKQTYIKGDQVKYSITKLYADYPAAKNVELISLLEDAVYRFTLDKQKYLLSADTGKLLSPINQEYAALIAKHKYENPNAVIKQVSLIRKDAPFELNARHLPVWRIDFDDFASPSFYISERTGELVTKRHFFWRLFDWMFSFHVMDFVEEDASNKLLLFFIIFSLIASLFGLILTYFSLIKQGNKKAHIRTEP